MQIPDELLTVFTAELEDQDGTYVIDVPAQELTLGNLEQGGTYRVALLGVDDEPEGQPQSQPQHESQPQRESESRNQHTQRPGPPVEVGERRTVDIESLGEQGDGIARVDRGYVVIVPDTEVNERVTIELTEVKETVGFGKVVERKDYYE